MNRKEQLEKLILQYEEFYFTKVPLSLTLELKDIISNDNCLDYAIIEVEDETTDDEIESFKRSYPNSIVLRESDEQLYLEYRKLKELLSNENSL